MDPWLVGKLTFADQNWLFEGSKGLQQELDVDAIAAKADLLIISQVFLLSLFLLSARPVLVCFQMMSPRSLL